VAKFLLLVVLGLLVGWWIAKRYRKRTDARDDATPRGDEDMVRCAQCGVHLPRSESLVTRGNYYCSAEHQRQHSPTD
jgi:uncharacterized protein